MAGQREKIGTIVFKKKKVDKLFQPFTGEYMVMENGGKDLWKLLQDGLYPFSASWWKDKFPGEGKLRGWIMYLHDQPMRPLRGRTGANAAAKRPHWTALHPS